MSLLNILTPVSCKDGTISLLQRRRALILFPNCNLHILKPSKIAVLLLQSRFITVKQREASSVGYRAFGVNNDRVSLRRPCNYLPAESEQLPAAGLPTGWQVASPETQQGRLVTQATPKLVGKMAHVRIFHLITQPG